MNKRWYPLALSISVVGCGGNVDDGQPAATGGAPQVHYGPAFISGGASSIDAGKPTESGGMTPVPYYGVPPLVTGGASAGGANAGVGASTAVDPNAAGGSTTIDTGAPATGGYHPIPVYMANLRLPPQGNDTAREKNYFALPFEPRMGRIKGQMG